MVKSLSAVSATLKLTFVASVLLLAAQNSAGAAEIRFLGANALEEAMKDLIPAFQLASGHKVIASFRNIGTITDLIRKGDAADLAIVSPQQWEELQKERKLGPAAPVVIAKVGIGVSVKKGAAKPDIASSEALKRTLLSARSIAVPNPASGSWSGAYVLRLFERLGITSDVKSKLVLTSQAAPTSAGLVAKGEAEISLTVISEILAEPDIELIGPLPGNLQYYMSYAGVIPSNAREPAVAKAFVDFLISPQAALALKSKGLEPG
jgi:molybdate transport system substrate-binding protein